MPWPNVCVSQAEPIWFCWDKLTQLYRDGAVVFLQMRGRPDMGTDTMSGIPIRNVQRETFNSQLSTG